MNFLLQQLLPDGGPRYVETDLSRWLVEPWNAASAALFLGIVVYWYHRLWGKSGLPFMRLSLPVLAIGGLGGTLYHGFRTSAAFLYMDWVPILVLCVAASTYFLYRVSRSWLVAGILTLVGVGLQASLFQWLPGRLALNTSYALLALQILLPLGFLLWQQHGAGLRWVAAAVLAFLFAITFRIVDPQVWLPMGTHFLWHLFGAAACHCLCAYLFLLESQAAPQKIGTAS